MGGVSHAVVALSLPTSSDVLPDLTDSATLGCVLALVREAWGAPHLTTEYIGGYWTVYDYDIDRTRRAHCVSEAEALVAALEAAP
jgi:hypothetical protein